MLLSRAPLLSSTVPLPTCLQSVLLLSTDPSYQEPKPLSPPFSNPPVHKFPKLCSSPLTQIRSELGLTLTMPRPSCLQMDNQTQQYCTKHSNTALNVEDFQCHIVIDGKYSCTWGNLSCHGDYFCVSKPMTKSYGLFHSSFALSSCHQCY